MNKRPFNVRLMSALLLAGALTLTGCSDNDYDFDQIDSTIGIGGNGLEIPTSSTEKIKLREILELEENGSVKEDEAHNYVFRQDGDQTETHPNINKITIKKQGEPISFPIGLNITAPTSVKGIRKASARVSAQGDIFEFHYQGDKPTEVTELTAAELDGTIELSIKFPTVLHSVISTFQTISISLPEYMTVADNGSSTTPSINGSTLSFNNVPTNKNLAIKLKVTKLNFKASANNGNAITQTGNKIKIDGKIGFYASGEVTNTMAGGEVGNIEGAMTIGELTINSATGRFNPTIDLNNLGDVAVNGVPDFLKGGNVVVDLYNPQISVTVSNDMDVEGIIDGTITSIKNGQEIAQVNVNGIKVNANSTSTINICRNANGMTGYGQVIECPDLSNLVRTIPDRIKFTAKAKANDSKEGSFKLGNAYNIRTSYAVDAPIAFAKDANIEYRDTLDGWNDDVQDIELAEDTYISATATVTSCVPAYLSVDVTPVDINKKVVEGINIDLIKKDIEASKDGVSETTSPIEIKISQSKAGALKKLDGLLFTVSGKADGSNGAVTGIVLNAEKHTLTVNDIKIKIVGKVIGDFN